MWAQLAHTHTLLAIGSHSSIVRTCRAKDAIFSFDGGLRGMAQGTVLVPPVQPSLGLALRLAWRGMRTPLLKRSDARPLRRLVALLTDICILPCFAQPATDLSSHMYA